MTRLRALLALATTACTYGLPVDKHHAVLDALLTSDEPEAQQRAAETYADTKRATSLEHLAAIRGVDLPEGDDPHAHPRPTILNWADKPIPANPLPESKDPKKARARLNTMPGWHKHASKGDGPPTVDDALSSLAMETVRGISEDERQTFHALSHNLLVGGGRDSRSFQQRAFYAVGVLSMMTNRSGCHDTWQRHLELEYEASAKKEGGKVHTMLAKKEHASLATHKKKFMDHAHKQLDMKILSLTYLTAMDEIDEHAEQMNHEAHVAAAAKELQDASQMRHSHVPKSQLSTKEEEKEAAEAAAAAPKHRGMSQDHRLTAGALSSALMVTLSDAEVRANEQAKADERRRQKWLADQTLSHKKNAEGLFIGHGHWPVHGHVPIGAAISAAADWVQEEIVEPAIEAAVVVGKAAVDAGNAFVNFAGEVVSQAVDAMGEVVSFVGEVAQACIKVAKEAMEAISNMVAALQQWFFDMFGIKENFNLPPFACDLEIPARNLVPKRYKKRHDEFQRKLAEVADCDASITLGFKPTPNKANWVAACAIPPMMKLQTTPTIYVTVSASCNKDLEMDYSKEFIVFKYGIASAQFLFGMEYKFSNGLEGSLTMEVPTRMWYTVTPLPPFVTMAGGLTGGEMTGGPQFSGTFNRALKMEATINAGLEAAALEILGASIAGSVGASTEGAVTQAGASASIKAFAKIEIGASLAFPDFSIPEIPMCGMPDFAMPQLVLPSLGVAFTVMNQEFNAAASSSSGPPAAVAQLIAPTKAAAEAPPPAGWILAEMDQSCTQACAARGRECDQGALDMISMWPGLLHHSNPGVHRENQEKQIQRAASEVGKFCQGFIDKDSTSVARPGWHILYNQFFSSPGIARMPPGTLPATSEANHQKCWVGWGEGDARQACNAHHAPLGNPGGDWSNPWGVQNFCKCKGGQPSWIQELASPWTVVRGPCKVVGTCIQSANYPAPWRPLTEVCEIHANTDLHISSHNWESFAGKLTLRNRAQVKVYQSGAAGEEPVGVFIPKNTEIHFSEPYYWTKWEICQDPFQIVSSTVNTAQSGYRAATGLPSNAAAGPDAWPTSTNPAALVSTCEYNRMPGTGQAYNSYQAGWKNYCVGSKGNTYLNNKQCKIKAQYPTYIDAQRFNTETNYDWLTVAFERYSGTSGPKDVFMQTDTFIEWKTDYSVSRVGWTICPQPRLWWSPDHSRSAVDTTHASKNIASTGTAFCTVGNCGAINNKQAACPAFSCPARCRACHSGNPVGGGVTADAPGGGCREHCSSYAHGWCGISEVYKNGGTDCTGCAPTNCAWTSGRGAREKVVGVRFTSARAINGLAISRDNMGGGGATSAPFGAVKVQAFIGATCPAEAALKDTEAAGWSTLGEIETTAGPTVFDVWPEISACAVRLIVADGVGLTIGELRLMSGVW